MEPILNFPHIHSINNGSLIDAKNFEDVVAAFAKYAKYDLYSEFGGVEYDNGNELKITAIKQFFLCPEQVFFAGSFYANIWISIFM